MMEITEMKKKLKKELDKNRYEHTKGVMYTAGCIAMAHGYDYKKAMLMFYEQNNIAAFKHIFIDQFLFAVKTYF